MADPTALYLPKGKTVGIPAPGTVGLFVDSSGTFKSIDETGAVSAVGASVDPGARKTADGTAASLSFTVAQADGGWRIRWYWPAGTAADKNLILQINSVATGYTAGMILATSSVLGNQTGDPGGGSTTTGFPLGRAGGAASDSAAGGRLEIYGGGTDDIFIVGDAESYASASGNAFESFHITSQMLATTITGFKFVLSTGGNLPSGFYAVVQKLGMTA